MGRHLLFDIEADRLELEDVSKVHCIAAVDIASGEEWAFGPDHLLDGVALLQDADLVVGHNIVEYDTPVLQKMYPAFKPPRMLDTLRASRCAYAGKNSAMHKYDRARWARGEISDPELMKKPHSLQAWGERLGERKHPQPEDFSTFTEPMLAYCRQDVRVNLHVYQWLIPKRISLWVALLETRIAEIMRAQRLRGVGFNEAGAVEMLGELAAERAELTEQLRKVFPPWLAKDGKLQYPKKTMRSKKYGPGHVGFRDVREGCPLQKIKLVEFNPASGDHIAKALIERYKWKPTKFTDGGKPEVSDKVLDDLPYPEAEPLARYQKIKKILGMLSDGDNAWLRLVENGRLHGYVDPMGTVTHRAAHYRPNLGQVPTRHVLGDRCRELFVPADGHVLVGSDAAQLQLRVLAHYLGKYDGGAFAALCEDPDGDVHTYFKDFTGLFLRDEQKTWTYAYFFGAGDPKLGMTVIKDIQRARDQGLTDRKVPALSAARRLGKETRAKVAEMPGMDKLNKQLDKAARRGFLRSFDGRQVQVLSRHRALNVLLMAGEAVIMKHALDILHADPPPGGQVLWVHDEFQWECFPSEAEHAGECMRRAIIAAGERLNLRVKLDAGATIGATWQDTH